MRTKKFYYYAQIGLCLLLTASCDRFKTQPKRQIMREQINTPDEAIAALKKGNTSFYQSHSFHWTKDDSKHDFSKESQHPIAVIVGCSDSRVSPEIIFDAGLGDLFTIRVAGNVAGDLGLESIVYGVDHLHAPLILVLGHQNCGAVQAVLSNQTEDIPEIATIIDNALATHNHHIDHIHLKQAIIDNILYNCNEIEHNRSVARKIAKGKVKVVGGYFDFDTGKVEFLSH